MMTLERLYRLLDPIVWSAHFQVPLPARAAELAVPLPVGPRDVARYWAATRDESRRYWHGATGRIAERLEVSDEEWERMVSFHAPEPPTCLGDSSHDYSYLIQRAASAARTDR